MTASEVDPGLWIRSFHPAPAPGSTRLVCLPHAGGSASFYFPVSRALAADLDVVAIQYPGRQDRRHEECVDSVEELARRVVDVLDPRPDQPVALFGHSLGATLGYEMARLMEQRGVVPRHLFASGRRAPSRHRHETVHQRDDEGILAELKTLSGTDARVLGDEEVLRMSLPAIRSDYRAAETYVHRPGPPLSCPITAFTGEDDPKVTLDEARAWSEHTTAAFAMHTYPGGHFFLSDHAPALLRVISQELAPVIGGAR
ncbi:MULTISPECIES: thioesterase II family protein [Streptomyces]|uniref:thioesterase II family protein n=1 Tax=Streptomyces TaxID=1883 RepID=UPI00224913AD|nr:alpha/beta fold hydrolase [Streptomyces sp. JHD 1]MCX2971482.1 alpha/beta fold hydrolase [Streptomyces sp. JHD 1]